ncbi:MAG: glycosyltransferase family 39 protein [Candidatus Peribacteraceae bacterium]|jgi:hypothetical protein|nr:glycosyltransferase family 39 protein [Candidatus Peribacteraceae bacterium]
MNRKTIQILSIAFLAALIIWGLYTLFYYMGVPYHGIVLMERPVFDELLKICNGNAPICRGFHSFWPILERTFSRMAPIKWYAVVCVGIYALWLGWIAFTTGKMRFRFKMRPWYFVLAFVASLWLIFAVVVNYQHGDTPPRRMVEPLPQVYKNTGEEGLAVLKANFDKLNEKGCLDLEGQYDNGARSYKLKHRCIHMSFFTKAMPLVGFILLLLFEMMVLGKMAMGWMRLKPKKLYLESMLSVSLGACFLIAILWFMAVISLHTKLPLYTAPAGWGLLVAIPLIGFKHARYWIKKFLFTSWQFDRSWKDPVILLSWLLLTYVAFNFLSVIRPFPIGWDDLGSYLNRPRLMVSYGHFIFSMAPFFWEYVTSLGYLLFGYSTALGASVSMMINWSAGLLAVFAIYTFARTYLGEGKGILSALMYYTLPMVGHFSFADMKIDNAVFFMGTLSVLCVFIYLFPPEDENSERSNSLSWLIAAGIFSGFAFAIKFTAVMVFVALGAVMLGVMLHWSSLIGVAFVSVALLLNIGRTSERIFGEGFPVSQDVVKNVSIVIALIIFAIPSWKYRKRFKNAFLASFVFGAAIILSVAPWILHNNILQGNIIPSFEIKAPNYISPYLDPYGTSDLKEPYIVRKLSPELAVDISHPLCKPTGGVEELDRYWGFENGLGHYLTLPWRTVMNLDSTGYYVTTTFVLLLLPLLLLLPYFWMNKGKWLRWFTFGTAFMLVEWMFLANGIPWYGLGTFLGLIVLVEVMVVKAPDKISRSILGVFIGIALLMMFGFRTWQYETQKNLLEYPMGKASADVLTERTVPHYNDVANVVLERAKVFPDRPYLYRMGTFIPYFIPRNLEIIGIQDHQLDLFNCMYQERDGKLLLERLKALGFNSIVFDTNTATIEKDPNGTLHQKVDTFLKWVNDPANGLQVVLSDSGGGIAFILIP